MRLSYKDCDYKLENERMNDTTALTRPSPPHSISGVRLKITLLSLGVHSLTTVCKNV